ncbi:MAG: VOC family protein [Chloroflexi bacterium]|nr:VOC family protein [Chloroflexota bacterium]
MNVKSISAITLAVADMARSVDFYCNKVGLDLLYGGESASFSSFKVGDGYLNLVLDAVLDAQAKRTWWGRLIFHVDDVDALYQRLVEAGLNPSTEPADASWGERYFHIDDPDSHELSFAKPL